MMIDESFMPEIRALSYYTFQSRRTHESVWLKPKALMRSVRHKPANKNWSNVSWDYFGKSLMPFHFKRCQLVVTNKSAYADLEHVRYMAHSCGFVQLKHALTALKRLRADDAKGMYDSNDHYGNKCQAVRREFRLIKITFMHTVEPVHERELK